MFLITFETIIKQSYITVNKLYKIQLWWIGFYSASCCVSPAWTGKPMVRDYWMLTAHFKQAETQPNLYARKLSPYVPGLDKIASLSEKRPPSLPCKKGFSLPINYVECSAKKKKKKKNYVECSEKEGAIFHKKKKSLDHQRLSPRGPFFFNNVLRI